MSLICAVGADCECNDTMERAQAQHSARKPNHPLHDARRWHAGTSVTKSYMLQSGEIREEVPNMAQDQDVSRRDFVKAAGAVTAVAAAIPAVHGAPAVQKVRAANDQVQFGIIGTGSRGSYLLKHLKGIDNGRCVAACDINPENLKHGIDTIGNNPKTVQGLSRTAGRQGRGGGIRYDAPVRSLSGDERRVDGGQARVLRKVPGVQARGSSRAARPRTRSIPSRYCRPDCSGATATSTRP